jgi:hypothetical protein
LGCGAVLGLVLVVAGGFLYANWDRVRELATEVGQPIREVMRFQQDLEVAYPGTFEVTAHRKKSGDVRDVSTVITWRDPGHADRTEEEQEVLAREIARRAVATITEPVLTNRIVVRFEAKRSPVSVSREFTFTRDELLGQTPVAHPDSGGAP